MVPCQTCLVLKSQARKPTPRRSSCLVMGANSHVPGAAPAATLQCIAISVSRVPNADACAGMHMEVKARYYSTAGARAGRAISVNGLVMRIPGTDCGGSSSRLGAEQSRCPAAQVRDTSKLSTSPEARTYPQCCRHHHAPSSGVRPCSGQRGKESK